MDTWICLVIVYLSAAVAVGAWVNSLILRLKLPEEDAQFRWFAVVTLGAVWPAFLVCVVISVFTTGAVPLDTDEDEDEEEEGL